MLAYWRSQHFKVPSLKLLETSGAPVGHAWAMSSQEMCLRFIYVAIIYLHLHLMVPLKLDTALSEG